MQQVLTSIQRRRTRWCYSGVIGTADVVTQTAVALLSIVAFKCQQKRPSIQFPPQSPFPYRQSHLTSASTLQETKPSSHSSLKHSPIDINKHFECRRELDFDSHHSLQPLHDLYLRRLRMDSSEHHLQTQLSNLAENDSLGALHMPVRCHHGAHIFAHLQCRVQEGYGLVECVVCEECHPNC